MKKMIFVVFSMMFAVAACNKNNSKADRVKPGAPVAPATTPDGKAVTAEQQRELEAKKAAEAKAAKEKAVDQKPADQKKAEEVKKDPATGCTSSSAKTSGSAIITTPYVTMNYSQATMTTEESKNNLHIQALLNADNDVERPLVVYCYDPKLSKLIKEENLPKLLLFPKAEALVEIKKLPENTENATKQAVSQNNNPGFMLNVCQGDESVYNQKSYETMTDYEIKKMRSGDHLVDYLKVDYFKNSDGVAADRDIAEISIACSHEPNMQIKLDRTKDETAKKVTNRITISSGSKLLLSRPTSYKILEKDDKKFQEAQKLKQFVIFDCE